MTTSPLSHQEIEPVQSDKVQPRNPENTVGEWRRFSAFLKRPRLPDGGARTTGAQRATLRMLCLDLPVMGLLIATLSLASAFGFKIPTNVNTQLELGFVTLALVVVLVPALEELAFRSWLSGHPSVIAGAIIALLGFVVIPFAIAQLDPAGTMKIAMIFGPALALIGIPLAAVLLLKRPIPKLFVSRFPVFFWLSTITFALVHIANYTVDSWVTLAIVVPLVLPQFILGAMLGYLRVHYGLIAAMALHAVHNGILFGLATLGKLGAEVAG